MNVVVDQAVKAFCSWSRAKSEMSKTARLCVLVGEGADPTLAAATRKALRPQTAAVKFYVAGFGPGRPEVVLHAGADATIVLVGSDAARAADIYRACRARTVPCCLVADAVRGVDVADVLVSREVLAEDVVVCDAERVPRELAEWLVATLEDHRATLGAGLTCCREVIAREVVAESARSNALVGALTFLKGADAPAMMATEVAMMYRLAATYNLPLGRDRVPDVAAIAVASLAAKYVAGLALRRLPLPAPLVKGAVAAAGTYAVGTVVNRRFSMLSQVEPSEGAQQ